MGQAHALISILFPLTMLLVGLAMGVLVPNASLHPLAAARAAMVALILGFGVFVVAKVSVMRRGHLVSTGTVLMSRGHRWLYRGGYFLMMLGLLLSLGVVAANRLALRPEPANTRLERTGPEHDGGFYGRSPAGRSAPSR